MLRRFGQLAFGLVMLAFYTTASATEIYPNVDENVRFHINVPAGKLPELLRWSPSRMPMVSQHRGGPMPGYPENAIETLDNALKYGPGIMEVDVATLNDGTMVLMHDYTLDRTTTGSGKLSAVGWNDVKDLFLVDEKGAVTTFKIPLLKDALLWAKGRAILNLDIKKGTDFKKVMEQVIETGSQDHVMAITYSLDQAVKYNKIAPDTMLSVRVRSQEELDTVKAAGIPLNRVVAWAGLKLLSQEAYALLHANGLMVMQGTLGFDENAIDERLKAANDDQGYLRIIDLGADVLATDRHWAAQQAIRYPSLVYFVRGRALAN